MFSQRWSVKARLYLLIGLFAGGLLTFTAFSYHTITLVKVGGPYCQSLFQGADEQAVQDAITTKTTRLMGVGLCVLVLVSVSGGWLVHGILRSLRQLMDLVQSPARENGR